MSTTAGKINLSIHEIQKELEIEGIINIESKNKIDKHLEEIIDHVETLDEERRDAEEELAEYEQDNNSSYRQRAEELETDLFHAEQKLKDILPDETLEDNNKNKLLWEMHKNLTLGQVENLLQLGKDMLPQGIIWKEKL